MKRYPKKIANGILFTDKYQLTMAQMYFENGLQNTKVRFDYFFRNYPDYGTHSAGYCINAGLNWLLDWMEGAKFTKDEIECLKEQKTRQGKPLFNKKFLSWLEKEGNFSGLNIISIPEGRVVHANVPITIVEGPLAMAQILESPLLNKINYQTLIATKASRIKEAAQGGTLIEFGMRRGQDSGANAGARAALIGGADFTSNVGISHALGFQPKGTHAHSMVQVFIAQGGSEFDAFKAYSDLYPDDCLLLVDTINTLESGIPNAIKVFEILRKKGHKPVGIRLDSGDLAYLAIQAAKMLDAAGFDETTIVLSNQLDELIVWQIITQIENDAHKYDVDAYKLIKRLVFGVGTSLLTSKGHSALDGVYKLTAVEKGKNLLPSIKISESVEKTINPGAKTVWRIYDKRNKAIADLIGLASEKPTAEKDLILHHLFDVSKERTLKQKDISSIEHLHKKVVVSGKRVSPVPTIEEMRKLRIADLERLDAGVKRIMYPHIYHVSLSEKLLQMKQGLVKKTKVKS